MNFSSKFEKLLLTVINVIDVGFAQAIITQIRFYPIKPSTLTRYSQILMTNDQKI